MAGFAYCWSCIGKGMCLQPAQQAFYMTLLIQSVQSGVKLTKIPLSRPQQLKFT